MHNNARAVLGQMEFQATFLNAQQSTRLLWAHMGPEIYRLKRQKFIVPCDVLFTRDRNGFGASHSTDPEHYKLCTEQLDRWALPESPSTWRAYNAIFLCSNSLALHNIVREDPFTTKTTRWDQA